MAHAVDIVAQVLGNFGKWQLRTMLIIFLCKIPTSWFMAIIIFTAPAPNLGEFWCKQPDILPEEYQNQWIKVAHPVIMDHNHHPRIDYCHVYRDVIERPLDFMGLNANKIEHLPSNATIVACDHFAYSPSYHSLVADYNLVCQRELLLPLTQCFHIFGLLVGGIIAFFLLKYVSPRNVMLIGMLSQIVCGDLTGMFRIYEVHVLFRWLSAISCALMYTSGQMILVDTTSGQARTIATVLFELFWSIGLIILPVFSLFIDTSWKLYVGISSPTILLVFLYRWLPDSPRWLLRFNRIDEAKDILVAGGTKNKRPIPDNLDVLLKDFVESGAANPSQSDWSSIWDGNPRRRYLFAVHYAWSVYILLFNCVVLNIRAYGRDHLQINTVAIGFSEIIGVFIGLYLVLYTRRRWLWSGLLSIFCGCLAYLTWLIPVSWQEKHIVALEMLPTMAIKTATSAGLSILITCTGELVAPEKRKILMFSVTVWARAWFVWAPFIFVLRRYFVVLPLTVFATLCILGGILTSVINHTHHKNHKKMEQNRSENVETVKTIGDTFFKMGVTNKAFDVEKEK